MTDLVFYDGVCGLCSRLTGFILARDRHDRFRFAALQGSIAQNILTRYGRDTSTLETVYVVTNYGEPNETLLSKSRAVLHIFRRLGGIWRIAGVLRVFPTSLIDCAYSFVARHRYRVFGRSEVCRVPKPEEREKFLDTGQGS